MHRQKISQHIQQDCTFCMHKTTINKAVIDGRLCHKCCHLWSYFKQTSFSCRNICRDIVCKHDVMNIQHARCGLVGPDHGTLSRPVSVSPQARNRYSYVPFIAKSNAACWLWLDQLGCHTELPWLMCIIHKTGSTQRIATSPGARFSKLLKKILGKWPNLWRS